MQGVCYIWMASAFLQYMDMKIVVFYNVTLCSGTAGATIFIIILGDCFMKFPFV